jgi:hypothetical protein
MRNKYLGAGEIPTIEQGGKVFSLSQLINKDIVAFQKTKIYKFPCENKTLFFTPADFDLKNKKVVSTAVQNVYNDANVVAYQVQIGTPLGIFLLTSSTTTYGRKTYFYKDGKSWYVKSYDVIADSQYWTDEVTNTIAIADKGDRLGILDTWVSGKEQVYNKTLKLFQWRATTDLYLTFRMKVDGVIKPVYVPLKKGTIDVDNVESQGAKDEETIAEEKADEEKTWYEKLAENLSGGVKKVLIAGAVIYVVVKLGQTFIIQKTTQKSLPPAEKK